MCWDFASIKTLETYLSLNNLGDYDFSELHLDYITSNLLYGYREIHNGGNFSDFQKYVSESGVINEEQLPYSYQNYSEEEYSKFIDMEKVIDVTETVDFPSIYKTEESKYTDEQMEEFRETVKKHIMKNGGLYTSIVGTGEKNYYADIDTKEMVNHAVTIVGWDDNYSKDNFISSNGKKPSKDGAYIALNSWGTFYNDGGYYYISYEDKYVECNLSGIISTSIDNAYKIDSIKNKDIKKYIKKNYNNVLMNYNGEEYISKNTLYQIRTLDLSNSEISSLDGIEIFYNLNSIYLSNNNIKDITPLAKLTNLNEIDLSNNKITDIKALKNLKKIYSVNLSNNKIKDISALKDLENEQEWGTINIDISNNPNIKGYEKLKNVTSLNISDCNIKDISSLKEFKKLEELKIANTPGIKGLEELPESIHTLDISNCNIEKIPKLKSKLYSFDISKNKLTTLDGIQEFKHLYFLDISENNIINWDALKELKIESDDQEFDDIIDLNITAQKCNIEDITVFNYLNCAANIHLQNNKIKDVSRFNNENIYYVDLSNNPNITGLQGLKDVTTVYLNDCNISDIAEILKLENVCFLGLENNKLTDITEISTLKNLSNLSLAGNKDLKGTIKSENIYNLNVSNCNLNDDFDFSEIPNLSYLNISKNPNIKQLAKITKNYRNEYFSVSIDEVDYEELEKILSDTSIMIQGAEIKLNYNLKDGDNKIDLSNNKLLKKELIGNLMWGNVNVENGTINKYCDIITIEDTSKDSVEIKIPYNNLHLYDSIIKIIFNSNIKE